MSRFFSEKYSTLVPYTPGEQPQDRKYVKLNTNESPFPPSKAVAEAVEKEAGRLQLYSDPECVALRKKAAEVFGVNDDEIIMTNGSDEVLNFAFMAFADENNPLLFADITYGFYPVFCRMFGVEFEEIPLREDFSIEIKDYAGKKGTVYIANPNAPTGIFLPLSKIRELLEQDRDRLVVVDEAYVDFGGESAVQLIPEYDNLLVVQTFSKSRQMAGARLGFAISNKDVIGDMNTLKYSFNPYNVNRLTMAAGEAAMRDYDYFDKCRKEIIETREYTNAELKRLGFKLTDSMANFVFANPPEISAEEYFKALRDNNIIVRFFNKERTRDYVRITIGTRQEMETLVSVSEKILKGGR